MKRTGPVERVRARLAPRLTHDELHGIPDGYQRLGAVVVVKLPESLRHHYGKIGEAYKAELGVESVLRRRGPIEGDYRLPSLEIIAGTTTETETVEHGIVYRFDAARIMFAAGNRVERLRVAGEVRAGEVVADLFAGIGYFTLPIALRSPAAGIVACEANPVSFEYLRKNLVRNGVADRVETHLGPNESAPLPAGSFDRVILGFLPNSLPWVPRALGLLRASGGRLHLHQIVGTRDGTHGAETEARTAVERAGRTVDAIVGREVKPYGPGRMHTVVDLTVGPR